jgi:hypothetical protein
MLALTGIVARAAEVGINWVLEKPHNEDDPLDFVNACAVSWCVLLGTMQ